VLPRWCQESDREKAKFKEAADKKKSAEKAVADKKKADEKAAADKKKADEQSAKEKAKEEKFKVSLRAAVAISWGWSIDVEHFRTHSNLTRSPCLRNTERKFSGSPEEESRREKEK
jgi:hypothetical protein